MADLIFFKIQDYQLAVKQSDILLILNKAEKFSNNQDEIQVFNPIKDIQPINCGYTNATEYIYFDGEQQLQCLGVSDIRYIEGFNEDNTVRFIENTNRYGIIGFIKQDEETIPIIDILKWLKSSNKYSYYWTDNKR